MRLYSIMGSITLLMMQVIPSWAANIKDDTNVSMASLTDTNIDGVNGTVSRERRQALSPEFNPRIGEVIRSLDENNCVGRFFCELGCDNSIFGQVGSLINTAMMFLNKGDNFLNEAYRLGQMGGLSACDMQCDSVMLHKIVRYANKQLFSSPTKPMPMKKKLRKSKHPNAI